jgi:solute carrier family 13 (sodium-dependent dicarboxylate transporter), member 2/3/5
MRKILIAAALFIGFSALAFLYIDNPVICRAAFIAIFCLSLWLTELIPLYATTLVLVVAISFFLAPLGSEFSFSQVLSWAAQPVLGLFFGGFVMGVAMKRYGLDNFIAHKILKHSHGRPVTILFAVLVGTAFLSMWMSNIAAAALMLAALRPLWKQSDENNALRSPLLLSVAYGANFGGMATPIGTGPNAIAIAAIQPYQSVTFVQWMLFAIPLTIGMLLLTFLLLKFLHPIPKERIQFGIEIPTITLQAKIVLVLFAVIIILWLSESIHRIPSAVVALLLSALLFAFRLLDYEDLKAVDWQTLILIAGGLILGELVDRSGLAKSFANIISWDKVSKFNMILGFVLATAFLSAIASNTAAAALTIPIALSIHTSPGLAIILAMGASMGAPFIISTPPNAMAFGEGGLKPLNFLIPGFILMLIGCLLISVTGERVLQVLGIP